MTNKPDVATIMGTVLAGDLARLTPEQRTTYYMETCASLGLNPLTRPFDYITLNGKMVLYAKRDAADQLRKIYDISIAEPTTEIVNEVYVVKVKARLPDGREDSEIGAVSIAGLKGDGLANAYMKAITKAKRRVTLSIVGLGILDESEIETTRGRRVEVDDTTGEIITVAASPKRSPLVQAAVGLGATVEGDEDDLPRTEEQAARLAALLKQHGLQQRWMVEQGYTLPPTRAMAVEAIATLEAMGNG